MHFLPYESPTTRFYRIFGYWRSRDSRTTMPNTAGYDTTRYGRVLIRVHFAKRPGADVPPCPRRRRNIFPHHSSTIYVTINAVVAVNKLVIIRNCLASRVRRLQFYAIDTSAFRRTTDDLYNYRNVPPRYGAFVTSL